MCQGGVQYFYIERYLRQHEPLIHVNGALMMFKGILLGFSIKSYMARASQKWKTLTLKDKWRHIVVTVMIILGIEFRHKLCFKTII